MDLFISSDSKEHTGGRPISRSDLFISVNTGVVFLTSAAPTCSDDRFKQLDFSISKEDWELMKSFIDAQLKDDVPPPINVIDFRSATIPDSSPSLTYGRVYCDVGYGVDEPSTYIVKPV